MDNIYLQHMLSIYYRFQFFFRIIQFMQNIFIREVLLQLNLNLDLNTIQNVQMFIMNNMVLTNDIIKNKYRIYGALAIVSQSYKILTVNVNNEIHTTNQISIQQIIKNFKDEISVEQYLDQVENLTKNIEHIDEKFIQKIKKLRSAYKIFRKYAHVKFLQTQQKYQQLLIFDMQKIVWIIYLEYKLTHKNYQKYYDQIKLLGSIILLNYKLFNIQIKNLKQLIENHFCIKLEKQQNQNEIQKFNFDRLENLKKLRYGQRIHLYDAITKDYLRQRIIDDLFLTHNKFTNQLQINFIDQILFLKDKKLLPPQPIKSGYTQKQIYQLNLNVINNNQQITSPKSKMNKSNFQKQTGNVRTRETHKQSQNKWIIQKLNLDNQNKLLKVNFLFQINHLNFQSEATKWKQYIKKVLQCYCPRQNIQVLINDSFKLYLYFLIKFLEDINGIDNKVVLINNRKLFLALLCIVTDIYLYINMLNHYEIKPFIELFDISYLDAFKLINKVVTLDKNISTNIKRHILGIQSVILLQYIWVNNCGYELLLASKGMLTSKQQYLKNRFEKHVYNRIIQLCNGMKIQQIYQQRCRQILSYILNKKYQILEKNNFEMILICSVYHALRMQKQQINFIDFVKIYQQSEDKWAKSNKFNAYDLKNNNMISVVDFYYQIFLHQIQLVEQNNNISNQFLVDPVKREFNMNLKVKLNHFKTKIIDYNQQNLLTYKNKILKRLKNHHQSNLHLSQQVSDTQMQ